MITAKVCTWHIMCKKLQRSHCSEWSNKQIDFLSILNFKCEIQSEPSPWTIIGKTTTKTVYCLWFGPLFAMVTRTDSSGAALGPDRQATRYQQATGDQLYHGQGPSTKINILLLSVEGYQKSGNLSSWSLVHGLCVDNANSMTLHFCAYLKYNGFTLNDDDLFEK